MIVAAVEWADTLSREPRADDFAQGAVVIGGLGLLIFSTYYGLRFLRRLLGA